MKKQNPSNKLAFQKMSVVELNDDQLKEVNGGIFWFTLFMVIGVPAMGATAQIIAGYTTAG